MTSSFQPYTNDIVISTDKNTSAVYNANYITTTIPSISIVDSNILTDDLIISRAQKPPLKVAETLDTIMERLLILQPDLEKTEKYPALKEAYDNYKMIEALIANDENKK